MKLDPPKAPFIVGRRNSRTMYDAVGNISPSPSPTRSRNASPAPQEPTMASGASSLSLTVNYLPTKFSSGNLSPVGPRKRTTRARNSTGMPKMGGGVQAFRSGQARMGGPNDDDEDEALEDGSGSRWAGRRSGHGKLKWNKFKWVLFFANLSLTLYCLVGLIACLLVWFDVFERADIVRVGNTTELVISTLACSLGIITSMIGWAGILLNNRSFLAVYTFSLWIVFLFLLIPGYMTYKRHTFNLEGKVNAQWSKGLGTQGRLRIQNVLQCCGYFSPFVEATVSQTCYARSILPGCKLAYMTFERGVLRRWYTVVFALVPVHLWVIIAGLLCSNHVTYRFGKGMMPKAYRLSMASMAIIMDNYANQLAEQYGSDIASDVLTRSRSNLQLDALPTMPYDLSHTEQRPPGAKRHSTSKTSGAKYDPLSTRMPSE